VEAAEGSGTLLMTAFCHRFHPPVVAVRALIDNGTLGRILMFRNRFGTRFAGVEDRWFSDRETAGGGTLMDTAIHSVDLFRHLVGEVKSATGAVHSFNPAIRQVEDSGAMLLTAEDGAIGVIEASWMTPWSANVVELYGERGAAVIDYNTGETRFSGPAEIDFTDIDGDRFVEELRHFAAAVRGETPLRVTGHDGLRAVEIIHEAYAHPVG
jgi:predicted dehydrogenase